MQMSYSIPGFDLLAKSLLALHCKLDLLRIIIGESWSSWLHYLVVSLLQYEMYIVSYFTVPECGILKKITVPMKLTYIVISVLCFALHGIHTCTCMAAAMFISFHFCCSWRSENTQSWDHSFKIYPRKLTLTLLLISLACRLIQNAIWHLFILKRYLIPVNCLDLQCIMIKILS